MTLASVRSPFTMASGRMPLVGHLPMIHMDALGLIRRSAQRLGPVFQLDYGFGTHLTFLHGDDAFSLLRNERVDSSPNCDIAPLITENSVIPEDGANHRRIRNAIGGAFSPKGLEVSHVGETIQEIVTGRLGTWRRGQLVDISKEARTIALSVIFRIMGIRDDELPAWSTKYHEFTLGAVNLPYDIPGSPAWRSRRASSWMNERLRELVRACRQNADRRSFLGALVGGEETDAQSLSEAELLGNLRLLGFAGHGTTASVITWAMLHMADQASLWDRICLEALDAAGPPMGPSEIARFPLAEAVFREAVRCYPPAWFILRRAREDFEYRGLMIPNGVVLGIPLLTLSRSHERYSDPDCFKPERWNKEEHGRSPLETCQFGGGPHFCLGYRLALLEGVHFIVAVARTLARLGCRPVLLKPLPKPRYLPITQAPASTRIRIVPC